MGLLGDLFGGPQQSYNEMYGDQAHEGNWTHEALAGAAAFFAMHEFEKKREREGKPDDDALAKELLAGLAAAEVDHLIQTKGLDYIDRDRARNLAMQQARQMYDQQYGSGGYGLGYAGGSGPPYGAAYPAAGGAFGEGYPAGGGGYQPGMSAGGPVYGGGVPPGGPVYGEGYPAGGGGYQVGMPPGGPAYGEGYPAPGSGYREGLPPGGPVYGEGYPPSGGLGSFA